jgi:pimeloyl-ACP methyl ester carboxylesterase
MRRWNAYRSMASSWSSPLRAPVRPWCSFTASVSQTPCLPLAVAPALREQYHVIRYRRRGHAESTPIDGPISIAEHAQDCRALLGELDVTQAQCSARAGKRR